MHQDLEKAFLTLVEKLRQDSRCKGGWHYGSISRGMDDMYSDIDPVFLVADKDFEAFAADVPKFLSDIGGELLICWPENYNDDNFKNFCNVLRIGENLHQHDFFIMNADRLDAWFCRQHLKGCTRKNIIFDRDGEVGALLDKGFRTDNIIPSAVRAMDTYWFHATMLIKYFYRKDVFKLLKNIDILFHAHADLLLSQYDTLDWGAWESKVKLCVPEETQQHLLAYFAPASLSALEAAVRQGMAHFREDAQEICAIQGVSYPGSIAEQTISHFDRKLKEITAASSDGAAARDFPES